MFLVLNSQAAQSYLEGTMAAIKSVLTAGRITGSGYNQTPRMDEHAMSERPKLTSVPTSIHKSKFRDAETELCHQGIAQGNSQIWV